MSWCHVVYISPTNHQHHSTKKQVEHADISDIIAGRHELEALKVRCCWRRIFCWSFCDVFSRTTTGDRAGQGIYNASHRYETGAGDRVRGPQRAAAPVDRPERQRAGGEGAWMYVSVCVYVCTPGWLDAVLGDRPNRPTKTPHQGINACRAILEGQDQLASIYVNNNGLSAAAAQVGVRCLM
jgi:hypothetical protein